MPHFTTWPVDLGNPREKFHVKSSFRFTKMRLTASERRLLEKHGTKFQAFQDDPRVTSGAEEYQHFREVFKAFEGRSVSTGDAFFQFIKVWEAKGNWITKREHAWLKYRTMLKEEEESKRHHENELIHSAERDEYIASRFVP